MDSNTMYTLCDKDFVITILDNLTVSTDGVVYTIKYRKEYDVIVDFITTYGNKSHVGYEYFNGSSSDLELISSILEKIIFRCSDLELGGKFDITMNKDIIKVDTDQVPVFRPTINIPHYFTNTSSIVSNVEPSLTSMIDLRGVYDQHKLHNKIITTTASYISKFVVDDSITLDSTMLTKIIRGTYSEISEYLEDNDFTIDKGYINNSLIEGDYNVIRSIILDVLDVDEKLFSLISVFDYNLTLHGVELNDRL